MNDYQFQNEANRVAHDEAKKILGATIKAYSKQVASLQHSHKLIDKLCEIIISTKCEASPETRAHIDKLREVETLNPLFPQDLIATVNDVLASIETRKPKESE